jgi:hypothetical protein
VPIIARVIGISVRNNGLDIVIAAGGNQGITATWKATIVDSQTGTPIPGGTITVFRVDPTTTRGHVLLSTAQLRSTPHVRFEP